MLEKEKEDHPSERKEARSLRRRLTDISKVTTSLEITPKSYVLIAMK